MKQPYDATISHGYNPLEECEKLIERCAPKAMRSNGGSVPQEMKRRFRGTEIAEDKKRRALELGATGKYSATQIAEMVGSTQSTIAKLLYRAGVSAKDGRSKTRRTVTL